VPHEPTDDHATLPHHRRREIGTTALHVLLRNHPEIFLPRHKESHFFLWDRDRRPDYRGPGDENLIRLAVTERSEYEALFAGADGKALRGESSVFYLYVPGTAERIARELPDVKLIALLRHPVQRAQSAYHHLARERRVTKSFAQALAEEERYVGDHYEPTWHFTRCGLYHEQLRRYLDVFDRRQLGVFLHDDFLASPAAFLRDVLGFLGVDPTVALDTTRRANQTVSLPRNRALHRNLLRWARPTRALVPARVRTWLFTRPPSAVPRDVAQRLVERFRPSVHALEELLKRDLSAWLSLP
jgi:hypothetical protein